MISWIELKLKVYIGLVKRVGKYKNIDNDKCWNSKVVGKLILVVYGKCGKMKYCIYFIFNLKNFSFKLIEVN